MLALTNQGKGKVEVKKVDDPAIEKPDDMIIKITSTSICGSDLHLYHSSIPLSKDYIIGHEPMGIVEEVGPDVKNVKKGDRVVMKLLKKYDFHFSSSFLVMSVAVA